MISGDKLKKLIKIAAAKIAVQDKVINELVKTAKDLNRFKEAVEIVEKMWSKGLINDNEIFFKIAEIKALPDDKFNELKAKMEIVAGSVFKGIDESSESLDDEERLLASVLLED